MGKGSDIPDAGRKRRKGAAPPSANQRLQAAETDLAERERALTHLLDALPLFIMHVDRTERVVYVNPRFAAISGYQVGEVLPFHADELHQTWRHIDTLQPLLWSDLPVAQVLRTGQTVAELLLAQVDANGQVTCYLAKAEPVHDAQGQVNGAIVILVDITAQRQAEEQTRQHAAQMDVVVESIREGVVIYDTDGRPIRYNPAAERILGWAEARRDPLNTTEEERWAFYDIRSVAGQPLDRTHALPLPQALAGEVPAPLEVSMLRRDQSRHIISVAVAPLRDFGTGRIFGAVGAYRDLTEQYLLEQMREEFLNMASHELRTPLTAMMLANHIMQQRLRRVADRDELLRLNNDMGMQIRRLNRLANNLLDLTSLIGNRFSINLGAYDAAQVIRETVEDQRNASKRTITLTGAAEPIQAAIDAQRLSQVLVNLLSNAIVHSGPNTPVEIDVRLAGTAPAPRLHVRVRDHGAGIPAEKLPHIFDRFAPHYTDPLAAASTVTGSGLGFGLYLARAIIKAHGGDIWADSTVGHGSTFTFELPLPSHEGGGL